MNHFSAFLSLAIIFSAVHDARAHDAARQMADAAGTFLSTLSTEQKSKALFGFSDDERENWHYIPRERKGLSLREMTPVQKVLGHALLNCGLSHRGQQLAATIMSLEEVLRQIEGDAAPAKREAIHERRDPEKFYISIFGSPAMTGVWGWRFEGHHLSLNFTIKDGTLLRATPGFFGSNPGEVRAGPRAGTRILAAEEDLGRAFAKSLSPEQWKKAHVDTTAPREMITEARHQVGPIHPAGISDADLNNEQQIALRQIIRTYLFRMRPEIAEERWKKIQSEGPASFAWAGDLEKGQPHYYRVQGASFLLEYDNTQNDANHIHTVWRDFAGDFGRDILGAHIKSEHK